MSGKVYSDAGTPSNAVGENGDIFMQLDGLKITYRKEGGAWTAIGNQLGTIPEFLKGVGVPSNVSGEDGQYYREVNTDAIYEKQSGVWTNIGSWTSLEIQQLLTSNGIGADLAVTNHVANIDTFIEVGAEGYFDNTTTGTKPNTYGRVKVRQAGNDRYQEAQTRANKASTRYSSNNGTTWTAWRVMANEDGDATRKFKALAGTASDDVAVVGQLPDTPTFPLQTYYHSGTDGYQQLPSGYLMQWGKTTTGGSVTITFPVEFDTLLNVQVSPIYDTDMTPANGNFDSSAALVQIRSFSTAQLNLVAGAESEGDDVFHAHSPVLAFWFAVGLKTYPL
jgi:hypothetical protein